MEAIDPQFEEFKKDLEKQRDRIEGLTAGTPYAAMNAMPTHDILKDIKKEGEEPDFWKNFREVAPVLFCYATDKDPSISELRDQGITTEVLKTKSILSYLKTELDSLSSSDVNLYHLSTSLKNLQDKIDIIKALKSPSVDGAKLKIQIRATNKNLVIDIPKLFECISIEKIMSDKEIEEQKKHQKEQEKKLIKMDILVEDHKYLEQKIKDFRVKYSSKNTLDNSSILHVMKLIGEFAKSKNEEIAHEAQQGRLEQYGKDDDLYIDTIGDTLKKEEENYTYCTNAVLCKLKIIPEIFSNSERKVLNDQTLQLELMHSVANNEDSSIQLPDVLTKDNTIEIIKKANDVAFEKYRELHQKVMQRDPNLMSVIVTGLSHDYILETYGFSETVFKAAMFKHQVFEDPNLAFYMRTKQMELFQN